MTKAHVGLGELLPGNCQQLIDKGANGKFVYLSNRYEPWASRARRIVLAARPWHTGCLSVPSHAVVLPFCCLDGFQDLPDAR